MANAPETATINYPYSDEYMVFDESTHRYVLTAKYVLDKMGIDLEKAINERNGINPQILINRFLEEASDDIYKFIHAHNANTQKQDMFIAIVPSLRPIIQKALDQQLMYSRLNGLLGYSADKDKQAQRICPKAIDTLGQMVCELGHSILYTGAI